MAMTGSVYLAVKTVGQTCIPLLITMLWSTGQLFFYVGNIVIIVIIIFWLILFKI